MPYRRLPNTDLARVRALKRVVEMSMMLPSDELAFSHINLTKVKSFLPSFEQAVNQHKTARKNQSAKSKKYNNLVKKARLYVSHFIQVLNFAIIRGELKPKVREFYQIDIDDKNVPPLSLENELVEWGAKIIEGEQNRTRMGGGSAIYSPSIATVKVHYEAFVDAHRHQKMLQNITQRASEKVAEQREMADKLILDIWNEIENRFSQMEEEDEAREMCEKYGVVYFYRPREKKKMEAMKLQKNIKFN